MIRMNYDPEDDVFHLRFGPEDAVDDGARDVAPGVFAAFDPAANPTGIEVISVRRRGTAALAKAEAAE